MEQNTPPTVTVRIAIGTLVQIAMVAVCFYAIYFFRHLLLIMLTAIVLAAAIEPAAIALERVRIPRVMSVIIMYGLFGLMTAAIIYMIIPTLIDETYRIEQTYHISSVAPDVFTIFSSAEVGESATIDQTPTSFLSNVRWKITHDPGEAVRLVSKIFGGMFSFLLILVISFYLAVQKRGIDEFLKIIIPVRHYAYVMDLWKRSQYKIGRWMQGQMVLVIIIGVIVYASLRVIGLPYALSLAVLAGFAELIPIFGPIIAAVPAIVVAASNGLPIIGTSYGAALVVAVVYFFIQQIENNFIYPWVVSKVVGVPPLVVILSLIIGGTLAGFLGIILAVPLAAALMEFTNDLQRGRVSAQKT